jgi:hypothetical protein
MNKRVVIHVGPPKTGTSAIQNWFTFNRGKLLENGLYYPEHGLDPNGISSGSLRIICDIVTDGTKDSTPKIQISSDKILNLLASFSDSSANVLFLSSEYFFQHMRVIKDKIPCVEFLAYIRNPIEIIESNYNQGVKRNNFTHTLNSNSFNCFPHVNHLSKYKNETINNRLTVRYFDTNLNGSQNLISDVLQFLNLKPTLGSEKVSANVNSSYSFEALELKRWLNGFDLQDNQTHVDYALQSYASGLAKFSLIPPTEYIGIAQKYAEMVKGICSDLGMVDVEFFSQRILTVQQKTFCKQQLNKNQFDSVVCFLKKKMGVHYFAFQQRIINSDGHQNSNYLNWFVAHGPSGFEQFKVNMKINVSKLFIRSKMLKKRVSLIFSNNKVIGLPEFSAAINVGPNVQEADILRELGFLAEKNGEINLAIFLLNEAATLRPNGKVIKLKLKDLKDLKDLNEVELDVKSDSSVK